MAKKDLSVVLGGGKPNEFRNAIEELKKRMPETLELVELEAKILKQRYDSLIKNKFTPEQAIELCKNKSIG